MATDSTSPWQPDQYWNKTRLYLEKGRVPTADDWERTLWYVLALEFLMRGAICTVHPVLNADPVRDEGANLLHALGLAAPKQPRSIGIQAVSARLVMVLDGFEKQHRAACDYLMRLRNGEVHSSGAALAGLKESEWMPPFYRACEVLVTAYGKGLNDLLGKKEAAAATKLIKAQEKKKLSKVQNTIAAHKKVFAAKTEEAQGKLISEAMAANRFLTGPRVIRQCPACGSPAILRGELERVSEPYYLDGELLEDSIYLANSLACAPCGLELNDLEELLIADVDPHFIRAEHTDLHEMLEPEWEGPEYDNM